MNAPSPTSASSNTSSGSPSSLSPNVLSTDQLADALPIGTERFGMWILLASLFMLFAGSMVAYGYIRQAGTLSPPLGTIHLPTIFWASTVALIASGITLHLALTRIKQGAVDKLKIMLTATLGLTVLFIVLQAPGMVQLLDKHEAVQEQGIHIYGLLLVLIVLHALHIVCGLIPMAIVTIKSWKHRYQADNYNGISYLAMYWHFLEAVWIAMFLLFLVMR